MVTSGPITASAPMRALATTRAFGSITAVGWMPSGAVIGRCRLAGVRRRDPEAALQLAEASLGGAQAARHVGQVLLRGEEPLGLEDRHGRRAQAPVARPHVLVHAGLGAEHRAAPDGQVVREAALACRDDSAAEPARA